MDVKTAISTAKSYVQDVYSDENVASLGLLLLLIVGSASPSYILKHKRLRDRYTNYDFELPGLIISQFSDIVTLPHILSETSSLVRQIDNPALARIQSTFSVIDYDRDYR